MFILISIAFLNSTVKIRFAVGNIRNSKLHDYATLYSVLTSFKNFLDIKSYENHGLRNFPCGGGGGGTISGQWPNCSCIVIYQWFDCHLPVVLVLHGISRPNIENCHSFPPPDSRASKEAEMLSLTFISCKTWHF